MNTENLYTPNCLRTFTGRYINLIDPKPETIFPVDIAIGLTRQCRFAGHTKKFYSVADHSLACREFAFYHYQHLPNLEFKALMHDAHEFILGDVPSPLKALLTDYEYIANRLQNAINIRFGISVNEEEAAAIKVIDRIMLEKEWETKVLTHTGFDHDEKSTVDLWLHHFVKLCKNPHVLQ